MSAHVADGRVISVNVAGAAGVRKDPVASVKLVAGHGVEGDALAGPWHRQVSLLAWESIEKMRAKGFGHEAAGVFRVDAQHARRVGDDLRAVGVDPGPGRRRGAKHDVAGDGEAC